MGPHNPDEVVSEHAPLPPKTVRLPERGFTIDRRKALFAAAVLWSGFTLVVYCVLHGLTGSFDQWGLMSYRTGEELGPRGPELVFESVRDVTALGGVFLRNLFALAAVVALLFLKLRREAVLYAFTVVGGWLANTGLKLLVGRERPQIVPHLTEAGGESFPSGPQLQRGGGLYRHGDRLRGAEQAAYGALHDHRHGDGA